MQNNKFKTKNAFTIVETLVTLLAITIMISAPFSFMVRSYNYSELITVKMIATGLSQEGLELATSFRNKDLTLFKNAAIACSTSCSIDWDGAAETPTMTPCADTACGLNSVSVSDGYYRVQSAGGTPTDYFRYLKFTPNGSDSFLMESNTYKYVNGTLVKVSLKKVISNLVIK